MDYLSTLPDDIMYYMACQHFIKPREISRMMKTNKYIYNFFNDQKVKTLIKKSYKLTNVSDIIYFVNHMFNYIDKSLRLFRKTRNNKYYLWCFFYRFGQLILREREYLSHHDIEYRYNDITSYINKCINNGDFIGTDMITEEESKIKKDESNLPFGYLLLNNDNNPVIIKDIIDRSCDLIFYY